MAPAYLGFKLQDSQLQFLVLPPFGAPAENDREASRSQNLGIIVSPMARSPDLDRTSIKA
jgi:hypothetical protein